MFWTICFWIVVAIAVIAIIVMAKILLEVLPAYIPYVVLIVGALGVGMYKSGYLIF